MRTTSSAADAARRFAEAHHFTLTSAGPSWILSSPTAGAWASPLPATVALGTMVDIVRIRDNKSWADLWSDCKFLPRKDADGGWHFPHQDTWAGLSVARMLRAAEDAGLMEGLL